MVAHELQSTNRLTTVIFNTFGSEPLHIENEVRPHEPKLHVDYEEKVDE